MKRLYKSKTNKVISGVIGGVGEYLEVDPIFLRLVWLFAVLFTGIVPGVITYIVAMLIVPKYVEQ